jgi:hypothetical protein
MGIQYSTTHRTNNVTDLVTQAGSTAYILLYSGSAPANCAAAATGTLLSSNACSSAIGTVSSGVLTFNAISNGTAAAGTAGYWRLCTSSAGTTCIAQGTVYGTTTATTNAATTAASTLPFASAPSVVNGQTVSGTGIPTGTYVVAGAGTTTLYLSQAATVSSGATITFGGDITFSGGTNVFTASQRVSISGLTITASGA